MRERRKEERRIRKKWRGEKEGKAAGRPGRGKKRMLFRNPRMRRGRILTFGNTPFLALLKLGIVPECVGRYGRRERRQNVESSILFQIFFFFLVMAKGQVSPSPSSYGKGDNHTLLHSHAFTFLRSYTPTLLHPYTLTVLHSCTLTVLQSSPRNPF